MGQCISTRRKEFKEVEAAAKGNNKKKKSSSSIPEDFSNDPAAPTIPPNALAPTAPKQAPSPSPSPASLDNKPHPLSDTPPSQAPTTPPPSQAPSAPPSHPPQAHVDANQAPVQPTFHVAVDASPSPSQVPTHPSPSPSHPPSPSPSAPAAGYQVVSDPAANGKANGVSEVNADEADAVQNEVDRALRQKEEKIKEIFQKADIDNNGYVETHELRFVLQKMGIADKDVHEFLLKRYDEDYNGMLDINEFCEMMLSISSIKKKFHIADLDGSGAISADEIPNVVAHMNLTTHTIKMLTALFDVDRDGAVEFSEFLPFVIYLNELVYQYEKFPARSADDHKWLKPLLGAHQNEDSEVALKLRRLKADSSAVSMDEFVRTIVAAASADDGNFKRVKAPQITKIRSRIRPKQKKPLKQLKLDNKIPSAGIQSPVSDGHLFVDPDFPADRSVLPDRARKDLVWKRPKEINENFKLFVDGVEEGDVIQGALGDCWFLGALAVVATSTNYIDHMFVKQHPERGYYCCQFFKSGKWQTVEVDDRLPCYPNGHLYFASCKDPSEFWVAIIEKAYAKLHGSYTSLEGGSISDGLKDLTGGLVETLRLEGKESIDAIWEKIYKGTKNNHFMGCAIDSNQAAETSLPCGLLVNHAYSIIKCKDISDNRLIRLRNPWGEGEWTGPWSDNSPEWTSTALAKLNYEFANDGTFFMEVEDFVKYFNRIYILCDVAASPKEVKWSHKFLGDWNAKTASGCANNPNWLSNPQYSLVTKEPNTTIFMNLSQPDLRYTLKSNPESIRSMNKNYDAIGVYVLATNEGAQFRKETYKREDKLAVSPFTDVRDLSFEYTIQTPGEYVIVPCTFHEGVVSSYELSVYGNKQIEVVELAKSKPCASIECEWKGIRAGGCINSRATWMNNPQFLLECKHEGSVDIVLRQIPIPNKELEAIAIYVFAAPYAQRIEQPEQILIKPKVITDSASISEKLRVDANEKYIIMPTLFDPHVERQFVISVATLEEDMIQTFKEL